MSPEPHAANPTPEPVTLVLLATLVRELSGRVDALESAAVSELMTRRQVADMIGVTLSKFGGLESCGAIGPMSIRLGDTRGVVRYQRSALRRWCEAGCPTRTRWMAMEAVNQRRAG